MTQRKVVLVGADGSAAGLQALDWAGVEAEKFGWSIHIATAYSLPSFTAASIDGGYAALDDTAIQQGARSVLDEAVARAQAFDVPVTASLETGDAVGVLVDLSREVGMCVVGTRGRGGFAERLLGTVSASLPAHAHCPTVVIPGRRKESEDGAQDRVWSPEAGIRRIVVGVDGSPAADLALHRAAIETKRWDSELIVVGAVPMNAGSGILAWLPTAINHAQVLADVGEGLDVVVDRVLKHHPGVTARRHVLDGTGSELLTEFSQAVDLIVVGSRGRGGFTGMLLGSTSQAVLHHSWCPVMVVTERSEEVIRGSNAALPA